MASRWENLAQELATTFHLDDDEFEAIKGRRTGREGRELASPFPPFPALFLLVFSHCFKANSDLLSILCRSSRSESILAIRISSQALDSTSSTSTVYLHLPSQILTLFLHPVPTSQSKFCALHLPRFIAAYSELLPKSLATFWTSLLVTFSTNPLFTRWVRQEDGMGLIATLGEGCCAIESSFDFSTSVRSSSRSLSLLSFFSSALGRGELLLSLSFVLADLDVLSPLSIQPFSAQPFGHARMIEALMQICLNTAMALPPPPNSSTKPHPFPPGLHSRLASALRRQGIAMVDFEDRYPQQIRQSQRRDLDRTTRGLYAFGTFVDAKTADAWRKDWTGRGGPVRWWACEGRSGRELRECVKLKEGGEMMACGRASRSSSSFFELFQTTRKLTLYLFYVFFSATPFDIAVKVRSFGSQRSRDRDALVDSLVRCSLPLRQITNELIGSCTSLTATSRAGNHASQLGNPSFEFSVYVFMEPLALKSSLPFVFFQLDLDASSSSLLLLPFSSRRLRRQGYWCAHASIRLYSYR